MKDDLQKSDSCGLKSERKKILTSSTCSLACLSSNLGAFCPMVVHLPSEKSILPYFSGPRGVAISVPFPEVRNRKGAESGLSSPPSPPSPYTLLSPNAPFHFFSLMFIFTFFLQRRLWRSILTLPARSRDSLPTAKLSLTGLTIVSTLVLQRHLHNSCDVH